MGSDLAVAAIDEKADPKRVGLFLYSIPGGKTGLIDNPLPE
jgi:hypothetical protein